MEGAPFLSKDLSIFRLLYAIHNRKSSLIERTDQKKNNLFLLIHNAELIKPGINLSKPFQEKKLYTHLKNKIIW